MPPFDFRDDPFEYPKAPTDMWTIADTVQKIAPLIDEAIFTPMDNEIVYVGTAARTVYELAKETRPDVIGLPRAEIFERLPSMEGLRDV